MFFLYWASNFKESLGIELSMSYTQAENVGIFTKILASLAFLPSQLVVNSLKQFGKLREQRNLEILAPLNTLLLIYRGPKRGVMEEDSGKI